MYKIKYKKNKDSYEYITKANNPSIAESMIASRNTEEIDISQIIKVKYRNDIIENNDSDGFYFHIVSESLTVEGKVEKEYSLFLAMSLENAIKEFRKDDSLSEIVSIAKTKIIDYLIN